MSELYPDDHVLEEARQRGEKRQIAQLLGLRFWQSFEQNRMHEVVDKFSSDSPWRSLNVHEQSDELF